MSDRSAGARAGGWIAWALVLYGLCVVAVLLVGEPARTSLSQGLGQPDVALANSISLTYDDGFYYFRIAEQIARGAGSTFDGADPTNGYHPLWLLCLVPIFWAVPTASAALVLGVIVQGMLMAIGAGCVYQIARLSCGRLAASLAGMLWVALTYKVALYGLEWGVHALLMLAIVYIYLRWFRERPRPLLYALLGMMLGLIFLARLDTLLLAGTLGARLAWHELRAPPAPGGGKRLLALSLPVAAVCLGYAGANIWLFGHVLPVSAAIKRSWSAYLLAQDPRYRQQGRLAYWASQLLWPLRQPGSLFPLTLALGTYGAAGCWIAGYAARRAQGSQGIVAAWRAWFERLGPLGPFVAFSLLQLLGYTLLSYESLSFKPWYYAIQPVLVVLLLAAVFDQCVRLAQRRGWALALVPALALGWCSAPAYTLWSIRQWQIGARSPQRPDPLSDATAWARANLPPGAVVGAWNAGMLGYFSGHRVVDLDGLVNSWDYYERGRGDLCRYWDQAGISYLVDVFEQRRALSVVPTYPAYAACADRLERVWSSDRYGAVWRAEAYRLRPARP